MSRFTSIHHIDSIYFWGVVGWQPVSIIFLPKIHNPIIRIYQTYISWGTSINYLDRNPQKHQGDQNPGSLRNCHREKWVLGDMITKCNVTYWMGYPQYHTMWGMDMMSIIIKTAILMEVHGLNIYYPSFQI